MSNISKFLKEFIATLKPVATSGVYSDLTGKPSLASVATSGEYSDLTGKPSLASVATSGSYPDLSNRPTIPAAQINSDWNAISGLAQILNKPNLMESRGFHAQLSADQVVGNWVIRKINLDIVLWNPYNEFNTTTKKFQPTVAGFYLINFGAMTTASNSDTACYVYLYRNGAYWLDIGGSWGVRSGNGASTQYFNGTSDYVELYAQPIIADIIRGGGCTYMNVVKVG